MIHANIFIFQFISTEYQTEVAEKDVREILVDVPHQKLIPAMFHLIWTKIRNEASGDSGDSGDMQNWPLKVEISALWFMFSKIYIKVALEASEEDFYEKIPAKFQVKHAVSLFIKVNNLVTKAGEA